MSETMRAIHLVRRPEGAASLADFELRTEPVPDPGPDQFLVRIIWLSLDPYMRGRMNAGRSYVPPVELGAVMPGEAVGEVIASQHPRFPEGSVVSGMFGWTSHALSDGTMVRRLDPEVAPLRTALGVLGMPGLTAWASLVEIARGEPGETIVVSAATGAVGGVLGQLARQRGLHAIGVAGGAEKCAYAVEELGYAACLDHRAAPDARALSAEISAAAPDGVQVYHDNVGGKTLAAVLPNMVDHGRIVVCGAIAWYEGAPAEGDNSAPALWRAILTRRLRAEGMIVIDHFGRFPDFLAEVAPLVRDGTLRYRESIAEGLEAAPDAFLGLLKGANFGKQLVRVGPGPD